MTNRNFICHSAQVIDLGPGQDFSRNAARLAFTQVESCFHQCFINTSGVDRYAHLNGPKSVGETH